MPELEARARKIAERLGEYVGWRILHNDEFGDHLVVYFKRLGWSGHKVKVAYVEPL